MRHWRIVRKRGRPRRLPVESILRNQLTPSQVKSAVASAGLAGIGETAAEKFSEYFDLLQRWNSKLNLTAIRDADSILRRHFVECIFCAQQLPAGIGTLLDFGSGGGFPGIPIAICRPEIHVTLAESQGKKASFLREAVRTLGLGADVYGGRVGEMAADRLFDAVTMRAVDRMEEAIATGSLRVEQGGWLVLMTNRDSYILPEGFMGAEIAIPGSASGVVVMARG